MQNEIPTNIKVFADNICPKLSFILGICEQITEYPFNGICTMNCSKHAFDKKQQSLDRNTMGL